MDFKELRCSEDGGLLISDSDGHYVCENCGNKYLITATCGYKSNISKIIGQIYADAADLKTKD